MVSNEYQTATQLEAHVSRTQALPAHALAIGARGMFDSAVRELAAAGWQVSVVSRDAERIGELTAAHSRIYPLISDYTDEAAYEAALTLAFAERGAPTLAMVWIQDTAPEAPQHTAQIISRALAAEQRRGHGPSTSSPTAGQPPESQHSGEPPGRPEGPPGRQGKPPGRQGKPPGRQGKPPGRPGEPPEHSEAPPETFSPTAFHHGATQQRVCRFFHLHSARSFQHQGGSSAETDARVEFYRRTCSLLSHIAYRAVILGGDCQDTPLSRERISEGVIEAITEDRAVYRIGPDRHA